MQKAKAVDDRERDKLDQELIIKTAEILGRYGQSVDTVIKYFVRIWSSSADNFYYGENSLNQYLYGHVMEIEV